MADRFGRQKSARWVNSVPTYGDWGDDEYGYDEDYEEEPNQQKKVIPQKFELPSDHVPPLPAIDIPPQTQEAKTTQRNDLVLSVDRNIHDDPSDEEEDNKFEEAVSHPITQSIPHVQKQDLHEEDDNSIGDETEFRAHKAESPAPQPNLVLSVDHPNNVYSDSSDDDDDDEINSEEAFGAGTTVFEKDAPTNLKLDLSKPQDTSFHQSFEPPTPTYSHSQQANNSVPESPSVGSDASFNSEYSFQKEPVHLQLATHHEVHHQEETPVPVEITEQDLEKTKTITKPVNENPELVLSVDKHKFDNDDDDDDDDDWGYNSQHSSNEEDNGHLEVGQNVPDIDSFIQDLSNHGSTGDHSNEMLPPLDHDVSLPDFENTSFGKLGDKEANDDDDLQFIKPLSISERKEAHDDYLSALSGRRQSVRKPPRQSMIFNDEIASIVGGYDTSPKGDDTSEESVHEEQHPPPSPPQVQIEQEEQEDHVDTVSEQSQDKDSRKESIDLAPPDLHPVISTGSLSTGKLSLDAASQKAADTDDEFLPRDVRDSRRISTSSNATFNLGGWTPNTDSFRNQFISENDNESINFNSDRGAYDTFTKSRTGSTLTEVHSNSSSISIPETIDAAMPSIKEDPASDDDDDDEESRSDVEEFHGDNKSHNPSLTMSSFTDSVLKDHVYQKPLFNEERLTPAASKDNLLHQQPQQKYQSLLPPQETRVASDSSETTTTERARSTSTSTMATESTVQIKPKPTTPSTTYTPPGKYPVSDWKSIVVISHPVDRIAAFKQALAKEQEYDTGLQGWLKFALKEQPVKTNHLSIGRVASQAYQNAAHNDIRRHTSLRSKVNIVKDKVEGTTGSFGKKLFSRSKKLLTGEK
ncbi:hypothetical protein SBY92_003348 [Candida maltosa Xu316]